MLSFPRSLKIYLALEPCDMRKSFDGLQALAAEKLLADPRASGAIVLFTNKRRNRLKILYWDGTGLWVLSKRLEQGNFAWPSQIERAHGRLRLTNEALHLLTEGIDLKGAQLRPWYEREE